MKKTPFVLLLMLLVGGLDAQTLKDTVQVHTDSQEVIYKWKFVSENKQNKNQGCYGCASFYYKVLRTNEPNKDGQYHFFLYFSSNSFYKTGGLTHTYIRDLKISLVNESEKIVVAEMPYVLVPPRSETFSGVHLGAQFVSENAQQPLELRWAEYTVY